MAHKANQLAIFSPSKLSYIHRPSSLSSNIYIEIFSFQMINLKKNSLAKRIIEDTKDEIMKRKEKRFKCIEHS